MKMRFLTFFLLSILLSTNLLYSNGESVDKKALNWQIGEALFYKVKYTFFTVGELRFSVLDTVKIHNQKAYHCKMHLKSANVPFLDLDDTFDSYIDADSIYSHRFWAIENSGDYWLYTLYDMDYANNRINITMEKRHKEGKDTLSVLDSTAVITEKVQDGLSILYYARSLAKSNIPREPPAFIFNELKSAAINFHGITHEIKARDKKVNGYYLDGKMKFVGVAGIKEDFKGWFSSDGQSIPLHAQMKAIVGSVKINLEWWQNWEGETMLGKENIRENEKRVYIYEQEKK